MIFSQDLFAKIQEKVLAILTETEILMHVI